MAAMTEVRNVLKVKPVSYDELLAVETTHAQQTGVVSGGQNGLPNTLPAEARGEYIYFKCEITDNEGDFILDGFELDHCESGTS